ncbi:MAG: cell division protein FtsA [Hydrogenophilus sp.]|nr:cell division protein FtsA [Hydrogenophilus sp.]
MRLETRGSVLALDVGTTKSVAVLARPRLGGGVDVLTLVETPTGGGLREGVIVNFEATLVALRRLGEMVREQFDGQPSEVRATISGNHIDSVDGSGAIAIRRGEVAPGEVAKVLNSARTVPLPSDRQLLHALVQEFQLDEIGGIVDPIGMNGRRLSVRVHLVTGGKTPTQNLVKAVRHAGFDLTMLMAQGLASAHAVLTEEEKQLGVILLDLGGGTTDVVVVTGGAVRLVRAIALGGEHLSHEVAIGLRAPLSEAETIKCQWGAASYQWVSPHEVIEVHPIGDRPVRHLARQRLVDLVHPFAEHLLGEAYEMVKVSGLEGEIGAGVVLTGGMAKLNGLVDLAEEIFGMPARLGIPYFGGVDSRWEDPAYAAVCGLLYDWGGVPLDRPRFSLGDWFLRALGFFSEEKR